MDRVTLEVIGSALLTIAEEMGTALIKSVVLHQHQGAPGLLDGDLRRPRRGHRPGRAHPDAPRARCSASCARSSRAIRSPRCAPGDVFIANDPYTGGGTHLPDINLVSPVFAGGALFGFVANIAHHADRSAEQIRTHLGRGPPDHADPPRRGRAHARGRDGAAARQLRACPHERRGDFRAQIAANRLGERRLGELIDRYGAATVQAACAESLAYGERKIRAAIAALPDGVYRFADAMDDDGVTPEPIPIAVAITKRGDALALDFAGSGPQCAGDINVVYFALARHGVLRAQGGARSRASRPTAASTARSR